jgi:phosphatidylglycerol:prolipoprotein diacylglycerol transferase
LIPFVEIAPIHIGPVPLQPFGVLVAGGLFTGWALAKRRAVKLGVDVDVLGSLVKWIVLTSFIVAHLVEVIFYHPAEVLAHPWLLLLVWDGLSSFGGFAGCVLGGVLWMYVEWTPMPRLRKPPYKVLANAEIIASIFPVCWVFGRAGCSLVHDHPGVEASPSSPFASLAVRYGDGFTSDYGLFVVHRGSELHWDLGFLELLFTIVIAIAFAISWRFKAPPYAYCTALCLAYPPVRFCLDFLRLPDEAGGDVRYGFLTPGQWIAIVMFGTGIWLTRRLIRAQG